MKKWAMLILSLCCFQVNAADVVVRTTPVKQPIVVVPAIERCDTPEERGSIGCVDDVSTAVSTKEIEEQVNLERHERDMNPVDDDNAINMRPIGVPQ
ncbi:MAG: hypothetical protein V4490_01115 [Pseudomonadota bacterium]